MSRFKFFLQGPSPNQLAGVSDSALKQQTALLHCLTKLINIINILHAGGALNLF